MLWIRALLFTLLVPGTVALWIPQRMLGARAMQPAWWQIGWALVVAGSAGYLAALLKFVAARGTPMIFFGRALRSLVGEEPQALVQRGLYRYTRNPMYVSVIAAILGQALLYASRDVAVYGVCVMAVFHIVVTLVEEPHLRRREGAAFEEYCRQVPRWLGRPKHRSRFLYTRK